MMFFKRTPFLPFTFIRLLKRGNSWIKLGFGFKTKFCCWVLTHFPLRPSRCPTSSDDLGVNLWGKDVIIAFSLGKTFWTSSFFRVRFFGAGEIVRFLVIKPTGVNFRLLIGFVVFAFLFFPMMITNLPIQNGRCGLWEKKTVFIFLFLYNNFSTWVQDHLKRTTSTRRETLFVLLHGMKIVSFTLTKET